MAAALKPAWVTALGGRLTSPVIAAETVFVAQVEAHTVHALNAADGKPIWRFTAGGRVDSPPTIYRGLALFGSADGYVYCLRAADGALVWRFRAAPADRRVVAYDQVESVWPVHGNVLVRNGEAFFVAGRSSFLDGGMVLHRLDARTGKQLSRTVLDSRDPTTGYEPARAARGQSLSTGCLPDVLSSDGESLFMRHVKFDLKGARQPGGGRHLYPPAGFVDDTWWHRTYWMVGGHMTSGWSGWPRSASLFPAGRILAVDGEAVYGYGRSVYATHGSHVGLAGTHYRLFATGSTEARAATGPGSLIRIENSKSLDPAGKPVTVEAWVKPAKPDGVILARGAGTHGYALLLKGGVPRFVIRVNKKLATVSADPKKGPGTFSRKGPSGAAQKRYPVPFSGDWTHLAGVLTEEKSLQIYVNGQLAGSAASRGFIAAEPGDDMEVGCDENGAVGDYPEGFPFTGLIDEVRVYHRALTADEIAAHAAKPEDASGEDTALVLALSFDDGKATDGSGNKNNGAPTGVKAAEGRVGQALAFTGEAPPPTTRRRTRSRIRYRWQRRVPLIVRAMVLAGRTLFVAGPPAALDEKGPPAALGDGKTGVLLAVSTTDGEPVAEQRLDSPPVFDSLAAAGGRLYVTTLDGRVRCLAGE